MAKGNQTQAVPLTFLSTRNPGKKLRVYDSDIDAEDLTSTIVSQAADITQALWNMVCHAHESFINLCSTLILAIRTSIVSLSRRSRPRKLKMAKLLLGKVSWVGQLVHLTQARCCLKVFT